MTPPSAQVDNVGAMLKRTRRIQQGVLLVVLLAAAISVTVLSAPNAGADGESFQIFRGPGGPYEIIVGVQPHKPKVGPMHISVSVLDPDTGLPLDGATILVVAYDSDGEPVYQSPALQNPAERQFYEANITFYTSGQWSLLIKVDTDERGHGEATVPMFISPTSLDPGVEGLVVLVLIITAICGGVLYLWWSSRRSRSVAISR